MRSSECYPAFVPRSNPRRVPLSSQSLRLLRAFAALVPLAATPTRVKTRVQSVTRHNSWPHVWHRSTSSSPKHPRFRGQQLQQEGHLPAHDEQPGVYVAGQHGRVQALPGLRVCLCCAAHGQPRWGVRPSLSILAYCHAALYVILSEPRQIPSLTVPTARAFPCSR